MNWWNPTSWFGQKVRGDTGPFRRVDRAEHDGSWSPGQEFTLRRFDAARTNRLNRGHWVYAHGQSINADLTDLPILMARCSHEAANNPIVAGALETMETDIVGRNGPRLQVNSGSKAFNERVEQAWAAVWAMPDPTGQLAGPENMRLWVRLLNTAGSYLNVFGNVRRQGSVSFGWRTVHPRRMVTPAQYAGDPSVAYGIRFSEDGRPVDYYISAAPQAGRQDLQSLSQRAYPADVVQHRFIADEPEQITGYPALTPCLEAVADLRDYDKHVMEAAKNAAAHAVGLEAFHPEAMIDPDPIPPGAYKIEHGQANVAPLGWRWATLDPTQPSTQYREYRHERLRELGLALGMPLMMILLSSADSNFASAHYDGAVYLRRIRALQAWLERRTLNELLEQVITELVLAGKVARPDEYSFRWTWEVPPYVNPEKQRKADRMAVEDGAMPLDEYAASLGFEWEDVLAARERISGELEDAGLPPAPVNYGSGSPSQTLRDVADDLDDSETKDADRRYQTT